jgi:hypothetical protein
MYYFSQSSISAQVPHRSHVSTLLLSDIRSQILCTFAGKSANVKTYISSYFFIHIVGGGVQTGSTRHVGHFWPIEPAPGDCEDEEFVGMKIGRGN